MDIDKVVVMAEGCVYVSVVGVEYINYLVKHLFGISFDSFLYIANYNMMDFICVCFLGIAVIVFNWFTQLCKKIMSTYLLGPCLCLNFNLCQLKSLQ